MVIKKAKKLIKSFKDTHLPAVTEDEDAEILIKKFNKCTEVKYYDKSAVQIGSCQIVNFDLQCV